MARRSTYFDGVPQIEVPMAGQQGKLPIFYFDGSAQTAVFPARLKGLRALLPDRRYVPARLAPGIGALAVSCFEYRDTDIGPYNELGIAVVLDPTPGAPNLPGRALLGGLRRGQLHAWVHHLPVTTEIARDAGRRYYNYPKFVAGIEFEEAAGRRTCRLSEGTEPILTLTSDLIDATGRGTLQIFSRLWMDRRPQSAEFQLNAHARGRSFRPGSAELTLADRHPIAREIAPLLISRRSIYHELMPQFEGILHGPDLLSLPLVARLLGGVAAEPVAAA